MGGKRNQVNSLNENEDMIAPRYGRGEGFYCRYEGEYSQRYLEESGLNWAMTGEGGGESERGEERESRGERAMDRERSPGTRAKRMRG